MEDSTSPAAANTSPKAVWPEVAVPGGGIPGLRGDQGDARTEDAVPGQMAIAVSGDQHGPQRETGVRGPELGDGASAAVFGDRSPNSDQISASAVDLQVSALGTTPG